MKHTALVVIPLLALAATQGYAAGDLSRDNPQEIVLEMGSNSGGMYFKPSHLDFATGKAYKLVLKNVDPIKHELDAGKFVNKIFTRKVEVKDADGKLVVEVKGNVREIEVGPNGTVSWFFVPVQDGADLVMDCALEGHKEAGMTGTITVN